jgi:cytochrome P450
MKPSEFPRDIRFRTPGPVLFEGGFAHLRTYQAVRRAMLDSTSAEFTQESSFWLPPGGRAHLAWYFVWATGTVRADGSPGRHDVLRGLIEPWFRQRAVQAMRPVIIRLAEELLAGIVAKGSGRVDIATEFAMPLAVRTVCQLTGVPADREEWIAAHLDAAGRTADVDALAREPAELEEYLREIVRGRTRSRADAPIDLIAQAWRNGTISELECLAYVYGLFHAGTQTTAPHIANYVALLGEFGLLDRARARCDDTDWVRRTGEEVLRYCTPFPAAPLLAVADVRLDDGSEIPAGTPVRAWFSAANRDQAVNGDNPRGPDPNVFDPDRTPNRHLAFAVGMHHCLGIQLARLESVVAVAAALRALPGLEPDPDSEFVRLAGVNDIVASAPFRFDQHAAENLRC